MSKSLYLLAFLILSIGLKAQSADKNQALHLCKGALDTALIHSESDIKDKNKKSKADTWLSRADIFLEIAATENEAYQKLCKNPYKEAADCLTKAKELDKKKDISTNIKKAEKAMFAAAEKAFKAKDYPKTIELYEYCFHSSKLAGKPNIKAPYNLAKAAEITKDYNKAIVYYQKSIDLEYRPEMCYLSKSLAYYKIKDFDNANKTLEIAFDKHPHNENVVSGYVSALFQDKRFDKIDTLVVKHPQNVNLITSIGSIYSKDAKTYDKAIGLLVYAIELDDKNFTAHNDLGTVYMDQANSLMSKSQDNKTEADQLFQKAMPLLEKAMELKQHSFSTKRMLKQVYINLGLQEKADDLK